MSSIAQIYELEFKNLLKEKLSNLINNISDNLIQNILNPNDTKYIKMLSDLETNIKELIINVLIELINFFNDKFTNSKERKDFYYINVRNDHRIIMTSIGPLEFYRTYFESKDRKEHFYFIDKLLGIDKYSRYDSNTKANAISLTTKTNQKLAGELTLQNPYSSNLDTIPRQTINRWIKNWKVPMIHYDPINIDSDTLYIMANEKFVFFSGIDQKGNRRTLKNLFVFITFFSSTWTNFLDTAIDDNQKKYYLFFPIYNMCVLYPCTSFLSHELK